MQKKLLSVSYDRNRPYHSRGGIDLKMISSTVYMFRDRGITSNYAVSIPPQALVDTLLSIDLLGKYYKNPDLLLANANYLVEDHWNDQYSSFEPFEWYFDWIDDYRKLCDNHIDKLEFNLHYRVFPLDHIDEHRTSLEFSLLNKWCNQIVYPSLLAGDYHWFDPPFEA